MKPGDVIIHRDHVASKYWVDSNAEQLIVLEEEATIQGCIMVRGQNGKTRCVNPKLFHVLKTFEERIAEEMMKPDVMEYRRVTREELMRKFAKTMKKVGVSWKDAADQMVKSASLMTASVEDMKRIAELLGYDLKGGPDGKE